MVTKFNVGDYAWVRVKVHEIKVSENGTKYLVSPTDANLDIIMGSMVIDEDQMAEEADE